MRIKPAPWPWRPAASAAPALLREARFLSPFWEGAGSPFDAGGRTLLTPTGAAAWQISDRLGRSRLYNTFDYDRVDLRGRRLFPRSEGTAVAYVTTTNKSATQMILYEADAQAAVSLYNGIGSSNPIMEIHLALHNGAADFTYQDGVGGTARPGVSLAAVANGAPLLIAGSWRRAGAELALYVYSEGRLVGADSVAGNPAGQGLAPGWQAIGAPYDTGAGRGLRGSVSYTATFARAWREAEIAALAADPFLLLTRGAEPPVFAFGATSPPPVTPVSGRSLATAAPTVARGAARRSQAVSGRSLASAAPAVSAGRARRTQAAAGRGIATGAPSVAAASAMGQETLSGRSIATGGPTVGAGRATRRQAASGHSLAAAAPSVGAGRLLRLQAATGRSLASGLPTVGAGRALQTGAGSVELARLLPRAVQAAALARKVEARVIAPPGHRPG